MHDLNTRQKSLLRPDSRVLENDSACASMIRSKNLKIVNGFTASPALDARSLASPHFPSVTIRSGQCFNSSLRNCEQSLNFLAIHKSFVCVELRQSVRRPPLAFFKSRSKSSTMCVLTTDASKSRCDPNGVDSTSAPAFDSYAKDLQTIVTGMIFDATLPSCRHSDRVLMSRVITVYASPS